MPVEDDGVAQVFEALGQADITDQVLAAMLIDEPAGGIGAESGHCRFDLLIRNVETLHQSNIGDNAVLAHFAADRNDLCDARNGEKLRPDHEVRNLANLHRRHGVARDRDQHDLAHDRRHRPHLGDHATGQLFAYQRQTLGNELAVAIHVRAPVELDVDDREADAGHRAYPRHARHPVHDAFDREGDELLDLLGCETFGFRHQRDDRTVEVRKDIDRNARQNETSVADQYQRRRQHEDAVAQAGRYQEIEHCSRPSGSG